MKVSICSYDITVLDSILGSVVLGKNKMLFALMNAQLM